MSGGGAGREGDTESKASFMLWAVSTEPNLRLELKDCETMSWADVGHLTDWATQAHLTVTFLYMGSSLA